MNCKFCGGELEAGQNICQHCGKEQTDTSKIIDAMPELHDELDRIGEMREKRKHRKRRVVLALFLILICAAGVWFGIRYFGGDYHARPADAEVKTSADSGTPGEVNGKLLGSGFTNVLILDEATAKDALDSMKTELGISDPKTDFVLKSKISVGANTFYRFGQTWNGLTVSGGEVILASSKNGNPIALNSRWIDTNGLDASAVLDAGAASNAVSEYVNKMAEDYHVTEGASVSAVSKVVCNFEGKTYLAYCANVSGYNEKGEYVAYDAFVDAKSGGGIYISDTAGYENEAAGSEEAHSGEATQDGENAALSPDSSLPPSAAGAAMSMFMVNDKFNWNDKTKASAADEINKADLASGAVSAYVSGTKLVVDKAYAYFADSFGYKGLDGNNGSFRVYLNANEYLKDRLPPEKALAGPDMLMFIQEDLTSGGPNANVAAHEYAHGVMFNIAQFDGTRAKSENAAVAEGLADVFGELAEAHFAAGDADWVHSDRNLAVPASGYFTKLSLPAEINSLADCYHYSTVVSHAVYEMYANRVDADALGELCFQSLCFMTNGSGFSQWRTITEYFAKAMADAGRLSQEQFAAVTAALDSTGIKGERLYARQVSAIGADEGAFGTGESATGTDESAIGTGESATGEDVREKVIE